MKWLKSRKQMDERELMEEYRIEHWMFWFLYVGLAASIVIQSLFMEASPAQTAAESVLLLVTALVTVILQIRKGQYDGGWSEPGWKSYLFYSLIFTVIFTALILVNGCMKGWYEEAGDLFLVGAVTGGSMFLFLYILLALMGTVIRHRRKKLEREYDE